MSRKRSTPMRFAVLLSGSGRTLENLLRAIDREELEGEVVVVVSSRHGMRGLEVAGRADIPSVVIERNGFESDSAFSDAIFDALAPYEPHLILLAGFLRKLHVTAAWEGRILNIHPALLPEMASASGRGFYGDRVHASVLEARATQSGATVHIVDNTYDSGPVIMKESVPVLPGDTVHDLAARVFAAECRLYPRAIRQYVDENASWLAVSPDRTQTTPKY